MAPFAVRAIYGAPGYHENDEQGAEFEVGVFLHGLIAVTQPEIVVEVGTHRGFTAQAIGYALACNGHGHLHTWEIDPELACDAAAALRPLARWLTIYAERFPPATLPEPIDLAFIDGDFDSRVADAERLLGLVRPGGLVLVHDTDAGMGPVGGQFAQWCAERVLPLLGLPNPRGLMVAQVPLD